MNMMTTHAQSVLKRNTVMVGKDNSVALYVIIITKTHVVTTVTAWIFKELLL